MRIADPHTPARRRPKETEQLLGGTVRLTFHVRELNLQAANAGRTEYQARLMERLRCEPELAWTLLTDPRRIAASMQVPDEVRSAIPPEGVLLSLGQMLEPLGEIQSVRVVIGRDEGERK